MFSQPLAICLLTALTASLMVLGWELCRLLNPTRPVDRRIELAFVILGVLAAGVLSMEWIDGSHALFDISKRLFVYGVGLFGFLVFVLLGLLRFIYRERIYVAGRLFSPVFLLLFLGMSVVAYARFSIRCNSDLELAVDEYSIGQVEKDVYWIGETDRGTAIPLFHFGADDQKFLSFAQSFEGRFPSFSNTVISRQSADKEANCHGWVFTGGKFLVRGESVEKILEDNGYRSVKEPAAGDVIVYRSIAGQILHTALVQAILNDGTVLAESKWGIDQRFIHLPEHQPYSRDFTYYRTHRRDHRILVHRVEDLQSLSLLDD